MQVVRAVLALLCLVVAGLAGGAAAGAAAAKPDFTLGVNPTSRSVQQGQPAVYTLTITPTGGFTGTVSFTATGNPAGTTVSFNSTTLTVGTASSTPAGSYQITVTGVSGKLSHSVTVGLTVNRVIVPSIALAVTPASVTVPAGSTAVYTISVTRTNFTGPITLSGYGAPGMTFDPNPVTGDTSALRVSTVDGQEGSLALYVVGSSAIGYAYAQARLVVSAPAHKPFTISGDLAGSLAPGAPPQPLDLVLRNPNNQSLSITNLTVTVDQTSAGSACDRTNFTVIQYSGPYPLTLGAGRTASLRQLGVSDSALPKVGMLDLPRNQDACKSVRVSLGYSGAGTGA